MGDMRVRSGVHPELEGEADRMLRESLVDVTRHSDKSDILTPWKWQDRLRREVYVSSGTPDPAVRKGTFWRYINPARPELNSREGSYPARPRGGFAIDPMDDLSAGRGGSLT